MAFTFNLVGFETLRYMKQEFSDLAAQRGQMSHFTRWLGAYNACEKARQEVMTYSIVDVWENCNDALSFESYALYEANRKWCVESYNRFINNLTTKRLEGRSFRVLHVEEGLDEDDDEDTLTSTSEDTEEVAEVVRLSGYETKRRWRNPLMLAEEDRKAFAEANYYNMFFSERWRKPQPMSEVQAILRERLFHIIKMFEAGRKSLDKRIGILSSYGLPAEAVPIIGDITLTLKRRLVDGYMLSALGLTMPGEEYEELDLGNVEIPEHLRSDNFEPEPWFEDDGAANGVEPQMEKCEGPVGDDKVKIEKTSNVVLTKHAVEPKAKTLSKIVNDSWEKLCVGETSAYDQLTNRWLRYPLTTSTGKWSTSDSRGKVIFNQDFPREFIAGNKGSPNCVMFDTYALFNSDIEVKITVNTNKFSCGQLRLCFYYGASTDKFYADRLNAYSGSQMLSTIIDAGCANDARLIIPYRYYKPFIGTVARPDDSSILSFGRLFLVVLSPLRSVTSAYEVDISMFVRFVSAKFAGMKPRGMDKVEPQMQGMRSLLRGTEAMLDEFASSGMRDNPPQITPAQPMVPWSAHSWCAGDMTPEPINPLRLQPTGQTPHPSGCLPAEPESSIGYIVGREGMVLQIGWKNSDPEGKILMNFPFSPCWEMDQYVSKTFSRKEPRRGYYLPPIAFLSKFFSYWRGDIEFKFDFVANQFHTGRLIIAFVPRMATNLDITIQQLTHCDHVVFDLREQRQLRYVQGYVSDKPWWPLNHNGASSTEHYAPGRIYVMVMNRLSAPDNVPKEIDINVYMSAGPCFELAVPTCPRIGHVYNTDFVVEPTTVITTLPDYGPPAETIGFDTWGSGNEIYFRYGDGSQHVTQFVKAIAYKKVYIMVGEAIKWNGKAFPYLVRVPDVTYVYGAPFDTFVKARAYADSHALNLQTGVWTADPTKMMQLDSVKTYVGAYVNPQREIIWKETASLFAEQNAGDEAVTDATDPIEIKPCVTSTGGGKMTFGESFTDIRQLCRRYQPYGFYANNKFALDLPSNADFYFPVMPQGLELAIDKKDPYSNMVRDGIIPLLSSGYRFYRGGVRYRIVVTNGTSNVYAWVQHRPEYPLVNQSLTAVVAKDDDVNTIFNPGFASLFQGMAINGVIEFEVPFYLPGQFGLLQRPETSVKVDAAHYSLGRVYVGLYGVQGGQIRDVKLMAHVFYSMADDMAFSVFQGFPPVLDLSIFDKNEDVLKDSSFEYVEPQMFSYFYEKAETYKDNAIRETINQAKEDMIHAALEEGDPSISGFGERMAGVMDNSSDPDENLNAVLKKIFLELPFCETNLSFALFSNLIHSIINPSWKTMLWSTISCLVQLGMVAESYVARLIKIIGRFLRRTTTTESEQVEQNAGEDDLHAAVASTCVAAMLSALGATSKPLPKSMPDFASYIASGVNSFTKTANGLCLFFQKTMCMFKAIYFWLVRQFYPDLALETELAEAGDDLVNYIYRIQFLVDPSNSALVRKDPTYTHQVYECASVACVIKAKVALCDVMRPKVVLLRMCDAVIKLRDQLTTELLSPPVRFEPFVLGLVGPSNVGKSYLSQKIVGEMLNSIDYKSYNEQMYTRTPGNAYWNTLSNQPFVLYDDFLCIQDANLGLMQAAELFCLKSKAVFNPPMAAIDDKNVRYNPIGVILASNIPYPRMNDVADHGAFWRRRDVMYEMDKRAAYRNVHPKNIPKSITTKNAHLMFRRFDNPGMDNSGHSSWMTYDEFLADLIATFTEYYQAELDEYLQALRNCRRFHPENGVSIENNLDQLAKDIMGYNNKREPEMDKIDEATEKLRGFKSVKSMAGFYGRKLREFKDYIAGAKSESPVPEPVTPVLVNEEKTYPLTQDDLDYKGELGTINAKVADLMKRSEELKEKIKVESTGGLFIRPTEKVEPQMFKHAIGMVENKIEQIFSCDCPRKIEDVELYMPRGLLYGDKEEYANRFEDCMGLFFLDDNTYWVGYCNDLDCEMLKTGQENDHIVRLKRFVKTQDERLWPKYMQAYFVGKVFTREQIEADVGVKSWKERFMAVLPTSWSKVFMTLLKISSIVFLLTTTITCLASFFCSPVRTASFVNRVQSEYTDSILDNEVSAAKIIAVKEIMADSAKLKRELGRQYFGFDVEDQANSYNGQTIGSKVTRQLLAKTVDPNMSVSQENVIMTKVFRNTFFIVAQFMDDLGVARVVKVRCLGLCGFHFLSVDHYWHELDDLYKRGASMRIVTTSGLSVNLDYLSIKKRKVANSAMVVGELAPQIPMFANIVKFIIGQKRAANLPTVAWLITIEYEAGIEKFSQKVYKLDRAYIKQHLTINNDNGTETFVDAICQYEMGGRGLCGSVLVTDLNVANPILGIHIAGLRDRKTGYSEVILQETFATLVDESFVADGAVIQNLGPVENAKIVIPSNVGMLGCVPPKLTHKLANKSKLGQTLCHGEITPVTYAEPVISNRDERMVALGDERFSPLVEAIKFHGHQTMDFDKEKLDIAEEQLRQRVLTNVTPTRMKIGVIPTVTAIDGVAGLIGYDGMEMDTSEGFPLQHARPIGKHSKEWLFVREETKNGFVTTDLHPLLSEEIRKNMAMRVDRRVPDTIFVDCIKDAKLPEENILKPGKIRIFSTSPVEYTIAVRSYFMDFAAAYTAARFDIGTAIGMDMGGLEVDVLVKHMSQKGLKYITGDYSKFGPTLNSMCVQAAFRIIREWYKKNSVVSEMDDNVRQILALETIFSKHQVLNLIYEVVNGAPSGNPLTVIINDLVNKLYILVAWQGIMAERRPELQEVSHFYQHCVDMSYGDDLWINISDEVAEDFNNITLCDYFSRYAIKFTDAAKSGVMRPYYGIHEKECSFLKRTFHKHPSLTTIWVARLDERALLETCNWMWSTSKDQEAGTREACLAMMENAYQYGEDYYNQLKESVLSWFTKKQINICIPTFMEMTRRIYAF